MENADNESLSTKVKEYESEIEEFFNTSDKREDSDFSAEFAKDEPRKSWESYTEDFPEDIFSGDVESIGDIEPVEDSEDDGEVEPVEEEEAVEDEGEIEPEPEEVESDGEIEPDEDDGEVEPVIVTDVNVIVVDRDSDAIDSATVSLTSGTRFAGRNRQ